MDKIKQYFLNVLVDIDTYIGILVLLLLLGYTDHLGDFINKLIDNNVFMTAISAVAIKLIAKNSNNAK